VSGRGATTRRGPEEVQKRFDDWKRLDHLLRKVNKDKTYEDYVLYLLGNPIAVQDKKKLYVNTSKFLTTSKGKRRGMSKGEDVKRRRRMSMEASNVGGKVYIYIQLGAELSRRTLPMWLRPATPNPTVAHAKTAWATL
jgi:hypothetical protein